MLMSVASSLLYRSSQVCDSYLWINFLWLLAVLWPSNYLHFAFTAMLWLRSTLMTPYWNIRRRSLHHSLHPLHSFIYKRFQIWILILWFELERVWFFGRWNCPFRSSINRFDVQDGVVESGWHCLLVVKLWINNTIHWVLVNGLCSAVWSYDKSLAKLVLCFT